MKNDDTIKSNDWKSSGFDPFMQRPVGNEKPDNYIAGESFDIRLDEMAFNRVIQFKKLDKQPQGNDAGKTYFDKETKKLYMWIDSTGKWAEILYTTSSISTTSTSTTSTSTT